MNERQHIALTEAQIIAAEKGELQLETRDGRKVVQLVWLRPPYNQNYDCVIHAVLEDGARLIFHKTGKMLLNFDRDSDLFISEAQENPAPKDLTKDFIKVGEIGIFEGVEYLACDEKVTNSCNGCDLYGYNQICALKCYDNILKRVGTSPEQSAPMYEVGDIIEVQDDGVWYDAEYIGQKNNYIAVWNGGMDSFGCGMCRKKQTEKTVTLEGRVMTVKEAFKYLTNL